MSPAMLINLDRLEHLLNSAQFKLIGGKSLSRSDIRRLDTALNDLATARAIRPETQS